MNFLFEMICLDIIMQQDLKVINMLWTDSHQNLKDMLQKLKHKNFCKLF